jgi:acetyltransferase-like isoleucine patch superfamily enzyme
MSRSVKSFGKDLHVGARSTLWAPVGIDIGHSVYIGKDVLIECNAEIGDYVMIANRVAMVGRHDHDFRTVGVPVRFSPWVGCTNPPSPYRDEKVVIEPDVWLGFGAVVLSGVRVGRGAIVAAGSVVTKSVEPYSIVGGNPARQIGRRFTDETLKAEHEQRIRNGSFVFSERGYDHWIVKPGHLDQ